MTAPIWNRVLITGAAGRLGSQLRGALGGTARTVRLTDIADLGPAGPGEEIRQGDLADASFVQSLLEGVDAVVHLGAVMVQARWEAVLPVNIIGSYNVYESARRAGVRRIVYASSSHAVGMHRRTELLDGESPARPDTPYGLSKAFGEDLARLYFDKHGIESVCLRIGSCFPKPLNERMLATWLSHADFVHLCQCALAAPAVGYTIVYGMSANTRRWWDNGHAAFLGYRPRDDAEAFAGEVAREGLAGDLGPAVVYQGGDYAFPG